MPVIYLKHPIHGSKVAISEFEVEHDKALGWEVYDPTTKPIKASKPAPVVVEPVIAAPVVVEPVIAAPDWLAAPAAPAEPVAPTPGKKKPGPKPKQQ